jgi:peptide/nickel transport system permease protein
VPSRPRSSRGIAAGALILAALALAAIVGPEIARDPNRLDLESILRPPSRAHWLGTDALGRDLAARVVHGARTSLAVGAMAAGMALALGVPLGAVAGYRGGWVDAAVSRLLEATLSFPTLVLALALVAASPHWLATMPDALRIGVIVGVTGWVPVARYVRGEVLRLSRSAMVEAARALGSGHTGIVTRHILPSALAPILVTAAFAVGAAITFEAALSFLGLGVRIPAATWGGLLFEARHHVGRSWWLTLFPGAALFGAVLACNLLAEGIRDRLDPRSHSQETLPGR